ncbi:MAG: YlbF family regulator [Oscillospiraceae bacterium]|nr:YlbF family regulator [Oscillospiraceae bacterium]
MYMDIIQMTRELGKAIQADGRYIAYCLAKQANDEDEQLQALINAFNLKRVELQMEIAKPDKDNNKIQELNNLIKDNYQKIMSNPKMIVYNSTKSAMDELMSQINTVISMSANGVNPDEIDVTTASCVGDCGSCGGCG